jgi:hypothetical protein
MSELTLQAARRISPRKVGVVLVAVWIFFAVVGLTIHAGIGAYNLRTFSLQDSNLDRVLSTPASITALLMFCASGMAFALVNVDRSRRQLRWRVAGWAFLAFGIEELLGVHAWLQSRGVSWNFCYLPMLVLGTLALLGVLEIFGRERRIQLMFGAAMVAWVAGGIVDNPNLIGSDSGAELLEMAAAIGFTLGLLGRLRYLARQYYPLDEAGTRLSVDQIAAEVIAKVALRRLAYVLPVIMGALALQYVLLHTGNYHRAEKLAILDLNNERTLSDTFQGALLLIAGGLAILTGRLGVTRAEARRWWLLLGIVLIPLGAEQILAIHSRFQDATGLPGQVILIPIAVFGVIAWLAVLGELSGNRLARALFIAGAAFWLFSQMSDVLLNPIDAFRWTITPEETAESLGSALWLFSFLIWLRSVLPAGLIMPPELSAGQLNGRAAITQLHEPEREQTPTE